MQTATLVYRPKLVKKIVSKCEKLLLNNNNKRKHFSVFVLGNRIIYITKNKERQTHPIGMDYGHRHPTVHSEFGIFDSRFSPKMKLFNIRFNLANEISKSTPCGPCKRLLKKAGIEEVYEIVDYNFYKKIQL